MEVARTIHAAFWKAHKWCRPVCIASLEILGGGTVSAWSQRPGVNISAAVRKLVDQQASALVAGVMYEELVAPGGGRARRRSLQGGRIL